MVRYGLVLGTMICVSTTALAVEQTPCYIERDTKTYTSGYIESIQSVNYAVTDVNQWLRKCTVTIRAKVKDRLVDTQGEYIFKDTETQKASCDKALNAAKKSAILKVYPEFLNSTTKEHCDTRTKDGGKNKIINTFFGLPWTYR
jgi:hypothetical protein